MQLRLGSQFVFAAVAVSLLVAGCAVDPGAEGDEKGPDSPDESDPRTPENDQGPAEPSTRSPELIGPIRLAFPPAAASAEDSFVVPDGATQLRFLVHVNATEQGPFAAAQLAVPAGPALTLRHDSQDLAEGHTFHLEPQAGLADGEQILEGPLQGDEQAISGEWVATLTGYGTNVYVEVLVRVFFDGPGSG